MYQFVKRFTPCALILAAEFTKKETVKYGEIIAAGNVRIN